ncbi:MAG: prevent-host-death family protein [Bacteroidetes bacterium]|nr:prevent-host-death family protein [Bacteroidota bacterium]
MKFAVISIDEFKFLKDLLSNEEKLQNFIDYIHVKKVKSQTKKWYSQKEVDKELGI